MVLHGRVFFCFVAILVVVVSYICPRHNLKQEIQEKIQKNSNLGHFLSVAYRPVYRYQYQFTGATDQ
jgi:hypothetical protein